MSPHPSSSAGAAGGSDWAAGTRIEPTWIPLAAQPAGAVLEGPMPAGVLEAPAEGRARGAVLIVGPLGREQVVSTAGLVVLSHELARRGWLVLRLSLRGTGDSQGLDGDDVRALWREDVHGALRELRRRGPGLELHAVGLRLGAAVLLDACAQQQTGAQGPAASAALDEAASPSASAETAMEALPQRVVLWEPLGGRAQLRRDAALRRVSVPRPVAHEGVEVAGMLWSDAQAESLRTIPDPMRSSLPSPQWSLRSEEDRDVAEMLWGVGSEFARVPRRAIEEIVEQLSGPREVQGLPKRRTAPIDLEPMTSAELPIEGPEGTQRVLERFVRVADGRPAVLTTPALAPRRTWEPASPSREARGPGAAGLPEGSRRPRPARTAVQLIAASSEPADGPTGLWAATARDLAAVGLTVLRAERPGCGILTDPQLDTSPVPYDREVIRAVRQDAQWLRARTGSPVSAVGLCVGSWLGLRAADRRVTERVIAINNVAWRPGVGYYELIYSERGTWESAPRSFTEALARDAHLSGAPPSASARLTGAAKSLLRGMRERVEEHASGPVRHLLALLGFTGAVSSMLALPRGAREIDLLLGEEDMAVFRAEGGDWGIRLAKGLRRSVRVHDVPSLDHALLAAEGRRRVRTMLRDMLAQPGDEGDRVGTTASGDAESRS